LMLSDIDISPKNALRALPLRPQAGLKKSLRETIVRFARRTSHPLLRTHERQLETDRPTRS
jgi:hypothetical protein